MDHYKYLQKLHAEIQPERYLEIGVETGRSLAFASGRAVGVDPVPRIQYPLSDQTQVFSLPSDEFFVQQDPKALLGGPIDFSFIDGMHLFEYSLRDFINVEKNSHQGTVIAIHDVIPQTVRQASRTPQDDGWAGDIFRMVLCLQKYRPDLILATLDIPPTGILLISNLDSSNTVLQSNYDEIVKDLMDVDYGTIHETRADALKIVPANSLVTEYVVARAKSKKYEAAASALRPHVQADPHVQLGTL